jgi:predicted RNA-binding Zn-ribbon protein involved in translation (DUF1610 family)
MSLSLQQKKASGKKRELFPASHPITIICPDCGVMVCDKVSKGGYYVCNGCGELQIFNESAGRGRAKQ